MPQIFHRSFNVVARVSIFGALLFLAALGWVAAEVVRSPYATNALVAVEQPVPFSHRHHVGELKIDCRYCHPSVEESAFAGMPTTKTCMNCHQQIWVGSSMLEPVRASYRDDLPIRWNRVHRLADFVKFNHSIHVAKGIGCVSCHGRVDEMPLTWQVHTLHMDWCLNCHRHPEQFVRPRDRVFDLTFERLPDQEKVGPELVERHGIQVKTWCSVCHY
jgi:hypothetical protein